MKKILVFRLLLSAVVFFVMHSCRTEDELNPRNTEKGTLQYGISGEAFLNTLFITHLKTSKNTNSKNMASDLTADELMERLDLEGAYLNSSNGKEVLHARVRTFGSYKRTLLSISENGTSNVFLFTYPDAENDRLFYITNLEGNLLKEVKIGDDGKEISGFAYTGKTPAQGKNSGCEDTIYETCSSGEHSFQWGNAYACTFWHNLGAGSPPKLFRTNGNCPSGGGSPTGTGDGPPGGLPSGGTGTSPTGNGGGPKHQLTPANCIQNLDCEECNIPGDTNNDCKLSYDEAIAFNDTPCQRTQQLLEKQETKNVIDDLKNHMNSGSGGEKGWRMNKTGVPSETTQNSRHSVNFGNPSTMNGGYHNHTGNGVDMFSATDIATLIEIARYQNIGKAGNGFMGILAPNGIHYVIHFNGSHSDLPASGSFSGAQLKAWNNEQWEQNLEMILDNNIPNNTKLEQIFLSTLRKMGLESKVALQKIDDSNNINTISILPDGTIILIPCN